VPTRLDVHGSETPFLIDQIIDTTRVTLARAILSRNDQGRPTPHIPAVGDPGNLTGARRKPIPATESPTRGGAPDRARADTRGQTHSQAADRRGDSSRCIAKSLCRRSAALHRS